MTRTHNVWTVATVAVALSTAIGGCGSEERPPRGQRIVHDVGGPMTAPTLTMTNPVNVQPVNTTGRERSFMVWYILDATPNDVLHALGTYLNRYKVGSILSNEAVRQDIPLTELSTLMRSATMHYVKRWNVAAYYDAALTHSDGISYDTLCAPIVETIEVPGDSSTGAAGYRVAKYIATTSDHQDHVREHPCEWNPETTCTVTSWPAIGYHFGYLRMDDLSTDPTETAGYQQEEDLEGKSSYECGPEIELLRKLTR